MLVPMIFLPVSAIGALLFRMTITHMSFALLLYPGMVCHGDAGGGPNKQSLSKAVLLRGRTWFHYTPLSHLICYITCSGRHGCGMP